MLGLSDDAMGTIDAGFGSRLRVGLIVAIDYDMDNECHYSWGCSHKLLVLWACSSSGVTHECDCGLITPDEL